MPMQIIATSSLLVIMRDTSKFVLLVQVTGICIIHILVTLIIEYTQLIKIGCLKVIMWLGTAYCFWGQT